MSIFDPSKPEINESPDQFPTQCQGNWNRLQTMIEENHFFNAAADSTTDGKHKFVSMREQSADPTTLTNEMAYYTKEIATVTELMLKREGDGTIMQMSKGIPIMGDAGQTFLPGLDGTGAILVKWGRQTSPGTAGSITFPVGGNNIAFSAAPYGVFLTLQHNSSAAESFTVNGSPAPTLAGFGYRTTSSSANTVLFWVAIGPA